LTSLAQVLGLSSLRLFGLAMIVGAVVLGGVWLGGSSDSEPIQQSTGWLVRVEGERLTWIEDAADPHSEKKRATISSSLAPGARISLDGTAVAASRLVTGARVVISMRKGVIVEVDATSWLDGA
jgi:hypothetical protein